MLFSGLVLNCNPPGSTSQVVSIIGVSHCARPIISLYCLLLFLSATKFMVSWWCPIIQVGFILFYSCSCDWKISNALSSSSLILLPNRVYCSRFSLNFPVQSLYSSSLVFLFLCKTLLPFFLHCFRSFIIFLCFTELYDFFWICCQSCYRSPFF